jgi:starch phosphorylase
MEKNLDKKVAYFSMEFALHPEIPNFAGGLGVLAADLMKSAADLELSVVGVSLIYHKKDDPKKAFDPGKFCEKMPETVTIEIEGREVKIG